MIPDSRPQAELADLTWMRRYGRWSIPATAILLVIDVLWPSHVAVTAFVASALAAQAAIVAYAIVRSRRIRARLSHE